MSGIPESIVLTPTIVDKIDKEEDMATALILDNNRDEQISAEFIIAPGTKFTLSGYSKSGSNWHVFMQKKFSNDEWVNIKQINSANPLLTLEDGGTFRIFKPADVLCLIDRD